MSARLPQAYFHKTRVAFIYVPAHRAGPNRTDRNRSAITNECKTMQTLDRWGNPCAFADLPLRRNRRPF